LICISDYGVERVLTVATYFQ